MNIYKDQNDNYQKILKIVTICSVVFFFSLKDLKVASVARRSNSPFFKSFFDRTLWFIKMHAIIEFARLF